MASGDRAEYIASLPRLSRHGAGWKGWRGRVRQLPPGGAVSAPIVMAADQRLLDADAAADMLARENSGFSVDASVRITLLDRDVPSYFQSLEHLLRYCARPPFALEWLSVMRGEDGRIACVRYVLPRHKAAN